MRLIAFLLIVFLAHGVASADAPVELTNHQSFSLRVSQRFPQLSDELSKRYPKIDIVSSVVHPKHALNQDTSTGPPQPNTKVAIWVIAGIVATLVVIRVFLAAP